MTASKAWNVNGGKKLMCLLLAALLICVFTIPAYAADEGGLTDARWENGYYTSTLGDMAGRRLYVYGLIAVLEEDGQAISYDKLSLKADEAAGRLDAARLLFLICGTETEAQHPFTDVPEEYAEDLNWLYAAGVTKGVAADRYGTGEITKVQFLVMLSRLLGWGAESPDAASTQADQLGLIPVGVGKGAFTKGDMYLIACALVDKYYPQKCVPVRDKMSSPRTVKVTVDSYEEADASIKAAAGFLPNRIEVCLSEQCPEADRAAFLLHFDWHEGDKQLPIIGLTNRLYFSPYLMNTSDGIRFMIYISGYAQGFEAFVCASDWLRVYKDEAYRDQLRKFADEQISPLQAGASDAVKAEKAHDLLLNLASYDYDEYYGIINETGVRHLDAHDILGFMLRKKVVCDGYANTYQWLLLELGIDSYIVVGRADQQSHAWNKVRIGGKWYNVDVCWDDTGVSPRRFFLRSDEWMSSHRHSFTDNYSESSFASPENYS